MFKPLFKCQGRNPPNFFGHVLGNFRWHKFILKLTDLYPKTTFIFKVLFYQQKLNLILIFGCGDHIFKRKANKLIKFLFFWLQQPPVMVVGPGFSQLTKFTSRIAIITHLVQGLGLRSNKRSMTKCLLCKYLLTIDGAAVELRYFGFWFSYLSYYASLFLWNLLCFFLTR